MYGTRCMFRHEHRSYKQLHRHYYTPQLYALETLFFTSTNKAAFLKLYRPNVRKLPVFEKIHSMFDSEKDEEDETSESELSDIEMSPEMIQNAIWGAKLENSPTNDAEERYMSDTT